MQVATLIGAALAVIIAAAAWRARALSGSGAIAAALLGTLSIAAGWDWGIVLVAYFASSTGLSRFRAGEKERRTQDRLEKGGRRDAIQVLANGAAYGVAAIAFLAAPDPLWQAFGAGALAASAGDTWATEIGTLAHRAPRSILTLRPVPTGTSGGITARGLAAAVAGAAFVALVAWLSGWHDSVWHGAVAGGIAGSVLDSVLGATVQSRRWCDTCRIDTERKVHRCGTRTSIVGGQPWLDNDGVNALSTLGGAVVSLLVAQTL